jgi:hypothetical protein
VKTPVTIAPEALDFTQLIRAGETVGWAEATAEPVSLTRLLDAQAERCLRRTAGIWMRLAKRRTSGRQLVPQERSCPT